MAVFKIVNEPYSDPEDIFREIRYIYNPQKCIYTNSINLVSSDPYIIRNQFLYVKSYYGKQLRGCLCIWFAFDFGWCAFDDLRTMDST